MVSRHPTNTVYHLMRRLRSLTNRPRPARNNARATMIVGRPLAAGGARTSAKLSFALRTDLLPGYFATRERG